MSAAKQGREGDNLAEPSAYVPAHALISSVGASSATRIDVKHTLMKFGIIPLYY